MLGSVFPVVRRVPQLLPRYWRHWLLLVVNVLFLASCSVGKDTATPEVVLITPTPTATVSLTPTPVVTPVPTQSPALEAMLVPGPLYDAAPRVTFLSGQLWQLRDTREVVRITNDLDIGAWAQTHDGSRIAFVVFEQQNGRRTREVRIIDGDRLLPEPLVGPAVVAGADDPDAITAISWSWDNSRLVVAFGDGSLAMFPVPEDVAEFPTVPTTLQTPDEPHTIVRVTWATSDAGVAYIAHMPDGSQHLYVTPIGDPPTLIVPDREASNLVWLPGRGRLAFVDLMGGPSGQTPGSVFTVTPDGESLELLVSAGVFAPAAAISALDASPDGRALAFIVSTPNAHGDLQFQSLQVLSIDSGTLREIPIEAGYQVRTTWWTNMGLVWRGEATTASGTPVPSPSGEPAFILGVVDQGTGVSTIVYRTALAAP